MAANYTAIAYALHRVGIISYDTYEQLRRRMMSFAIEIEGLNGTPTLPDGSVPKACQNVTGLGHGVNSIRAGVRELGNLLSSTPGVYGNDEYKPIGMPDIYVGAIMKLLGRRRFDKLVSILLPGLQPQRDMGAFLEQMRRQGSLVTAARNRKKSRDNMEEEKRLDKNAKQRARYASLPKAGKRKYNRYSIFDCNHCGRTYESLGQGIHHMSTNVINEVNLQCRQICQHTKIVEGVTWRCRVKDTNIQPLATINHPFVD